jgi:hypothetical protein
MDPHELVKRLALRLKIRNIGGNVIHHVALLKKALEAQKIQAKMIKGYCVIEETKEACEHYWVREEATGLDLDVAFAVARLRSPELIYLNPVLLESLPQGLERSDTEARQILAENSRLFDLYHSNPKEFWSAAPRDVATFHLK